MFEGWDNFYILIGSASGALIGLLFIVVTLTGGMDRDQALRGASRYMTPTVVEFTAVLLISAIASAPADARLQRAALLILALVLCAWALVNCRRMFFQPLGAQPTHWSDPWFYAAAPAASYAALAAVAVLGWAMGVGVVAVTILVLGVRNAWDLITWIAPGGPNAKPAPPPE
jgi:hypothetical protein